MPASPPSTEPAVTDADVELASELSAAMTRLFRMLGTVKTQLTSSQQPGEWACFGILATLTEHGAIRQTAIAEAMHADPSTISRQVAHLVSVGALERRADPADGRASLLALTDQGLELHAQQRRRRDEYFAQLVADWPERDRRRLAGLMDRLATDMAAQLPANITDARTENQ